MKRRVCGVSLKWPRQLEDRVLVDASLDHRVDLHRQPGGGGRVDPLEDALDREVDVVQRPEGLVVERVEADRDSAQPGVGEGTGLLRQQRAVRRQREVDVERRERLEQPLELAAEQRLAARDPDLLDAARDEDPRQALELLEGEQLLALEEAVVPSEDLLRHAVDAAEVAAVGDGDPQVPERPAERVQSVHGIESTPKGAGSCRR